MCILSAFEDLKLSLNKVPILEEMITSYLEKLPQKNIQDVRVEGVITLLYSYDVQFSPLYGKSHVRFMPENIERQVRDRYVMLTRSTSTEALNNSPENVSQEDLPKLLPGLWKKYKLWFLVLAISLALLIGYAIGRV